jgi:hypothetical protein
MNTTLPTDSNDRKNYALFRGCLRYFPAALAGVAKTSKLGNDKHNPGQEMHHARSKSLDHGDCIMRHLMDLEDLISAMNRGEKVTEEMILAEADCMAWRSLALSQELHEKFGAPLAPGAKINSQPDSKTTKSLSLYAEAEKAHDEIKERLIQNKINIAKRFVKGDAVKHIDNDAEVIVEALYYDEKGSPILFVKDADEKIFGVDPSFYRSIYKEKVSNESN